MLLVADSGSTKADWTFYDVDGTQTRVTSIGVNPNLHSPAEIQTVLESVCPVTIQEAKVREVYYYGTGIWDKRRAAVLGSALRSCYPNAEVEIHHDLLGAARAACGDGPGIACILGTGSNSCLYDGVKVRDNVTNLGWLIGDEGSGVDLGRRLIRAYSYRELPPDDREHFEEETGYNKATIGDGLYGTGNANRFLASFSPFIHDNLDRPAIRRLVVASFEEFLTCHVLKYEGAKRLPVSFIGSIAYHYADILREVLTEHELTVGSIKKKPIDALVAYHCPEREPPVHERSN